MTVEKTQQPLGVASDLNAELGFKVGDRCLVVFKPNSLNYIDDGIVIECHVEAIEQTTKTDSVSEKTSKRYTVCFGLQSTTVTDEVLFTFEQIEEANALAKTYLTQSITNVKARLSELESALALIKT